MYTLLAVFVCFITIPRCRSKNNLMPTMIARSIGPYNVYFVPTLTFEATNKTKNKMIKKLVNHKIKEAKIT